MPPMLESLRQGLRASDTHLRGLSARRVSLAAVLLLGMLAVILIVIAADLSAVVRLPFYPFATQGAIYVDSPEVYTRERLVNDRYDQDHWLRRQLDELDADANLLTGRVSVRRAVGLGAGDTATTSPADLDGPADVPPDEKLELPFDQEFRIRAATRDMIRQTILENMLDDRHDLTGNSVYGLKFDTTVIPGTNTYQRAFVRISLEVEPLFDGDGGSVDGLPTHVRQFLDLGFAGIAERNDNQLFKPYDLYARWLESIEFRLNNYLSVLYDSRYFRSACEGLGAGQEGRPAKHVLLHDTTWKMFEVVLGMDQRPVVPGMDQRPVLPEADETANLPSSINVPEPWADFLLLQRVGDDLCQERGVHFVVTPLLETIYIFPAAEGSLGSDLIDPAAVGYFPVSRTESGEQVAVPNPYGPSLTHEQYESIRPHYTITGPLIAYAKKRSRLFPACAKRPDKTDACEVSIQAATVPSGFFNFVERIIRTDAYSYAIFPKNDLIGLISDSSQSTSLHERLAGDAGVSAWLELVQAMREASTRSLAVGFGDQSSIHDRRVEFGWVLSNRGDMQPVQKAQLALVSVPAWSSELRVHVTIGWLDRNSSEQAARTVAMLVPLPPEYEAFDSYVGRSQLRRQPKILNDFLEDDITLTACRTAEILIPGFRLWRSTSVTLGAQQADRIRVLPNMQGIVAHFESVHLPNARIAEGEAAVPLRVWTSEGMDVAEKTVRIRLPKDFADDRCPQEQDAG